MVRNLKILQCIRKLWPGQVNPDTFTQHATDTKQPLWKLSQAQCKQATKWGIMDQNRRSFLAELGANVKRSFTFNVLYRTFTVLYRTFTVLYRTFTVLYRTFTVLYRTFTVLYWTFTVLYRTFTVLYWTFTVLHRTFTVLYKNF